MDQLIKELESLHFKVDKEDYWGKPLGSFCDHCFSSSGEYGEDTYVEWPCETAEIIQAYKDSHTN